MCNNPVKTSFPERVLEILTANGSVRPDQIEEARELKKTSNENILDILVNKNYVEDIDMTIARGLCMDPPVDVVAPYRLNIPPEIRDLIPLEVAKEHKVVPIWKVGNTLVVAMANPNDIDAVEAIKRHTKLDLVKLISTSAGIENTLSPVAGADSKMDEIVKKSENEAQPEFVKESQIKEIDVDKLESDGGDSQIAQIVNAILLYALGKNASDIHIEPMENRTRVRFRIDGKLIEYPGHFEKHLHRSIVSRIIIISGLNIAEPFKPQSGRARMISAGNKIDLRIEIQNITHGQKVVIRLLNQGTLPAGVDHLGLDKTTLKLFRDAIDAPHGMILVTGPTGSGKTTTLYTVLQELNKTEHNITTVEDPVEYQLPGINHIPINEAQGITFASSLRSILRGDPDIVMVGEIRDNETADIAIKAAMTGHQVLSTLHTNDAASAIARLVKMGIEPILIADSVLLVCAQRLVRRICPNCRTEYQPEAGILAKLGIPGATFYRGNGCDRCSHRGYYGRVPIVEALLITPTIKEMICEEGQATAAKLKEQGIKEGMRTLRMVGIEKAREGITTLDEVYATTASD